ncbi:hypothetical protein [Methylocaldum szegediense]|uniref:hypothetical protein n=1 Tax=Methylocaldum szegediense TaxID=73780 RepID=UPI0004200D7A|nr:hypothetical protein [Methylocaldum szegediense]
MDSLTEGLILARTYWYILATMALTLAVVFWWDQVRYFFMRLGVWFPLIGTIARESRKPHIKSRETDGVVWYKSEEALCARFYAHYISFTKDAAFFDKCADYLNKADERGRRPKSLPMWIGTIILVLLEAYIFSLVLVPFMDNRVSSNQAIFAAWGLAIMIAVILVTVTHMMGWEIHRNALLKKARTWYENARRDHSAKALKPSGRIDLDRTYEDNDEPEYIQIVNRVPHNASVKGGWVLTVVAVTLITIFAVGAYWIRSLTINELETGQVNNSPFTQQGGLDSGGTMSLFDLPQEAQNDGQAADERANSEILSARIQAYKTTFAILSVIFVGIQIVGVMVGFFRSFAGKQSKDAAKFIGRFNSAEEFAAYYEQKRERIAADAQAALDALHQRIEQRHVLAGSDGSGFMRGTFDHYVRMRRLNKYRDRLGDEKQRLELEREHAARAVAATPPPAPQVSVAAPAAHAEAAPMPDPAPASETESLIAGLGDLTLYSEQELLEIAKELGIDFALLQRKRKVQAAIARARGGQAGGAA